MRHFRKRENDDEKLATEKKKLLVQHTNNWHDPALNVDLLAVLRDFFLCVGRQLSVDNHLPLVWFWNETEKKRRR